MSSILPPRARRGLVVSSLILVPPAYTTQTIHGQEANPSLSTEVSRPGASTLGLGMARLTFDETRPVYFRDQDDQIVDSITFNAPPNVGGIRTAPPWLHPEYLKEDYQALLLRIVAADGSHVWVVTNRQTQQRGQVRGPERVLLRPSHVLEPHPP